MQYLASVSITSADITGFDSLRLDINPPGSMCSFESGDVDHCSWRNQFDNGPESPKASRLYLMRKGVSFEFVHCRGLCVLRKQPSSYRLVGFRTNHSAHSLKLETVSGQPRGSID